MEIRMPQPGETVAEAVITSWKKSVGDFVQAGDVLFEIDTDKTAMEVPATAPGVLAEIRVSAGESALVNAVVGVLTTGAETAPPPGAGPPAADPVSAPAASPAAPRSGGGLYPPAALANGVRVTPLARRLAAERGVDLARLTGSGPHGRIVAADVKVEAAVPAPAAPPPSSETADDILALYGEVPYEEVPLDGMRRTIAQRLVLSKQTVPHFYLTIDVNLERLLMLRGEINAGQEVKITVNDFVVKAFAQALHIHPDANAVWAHDRILRFRHADVGVAVSVEGGLFTPVVRRAETKSLAALSAEIKDLARRARERRLDRSEYEGGAAAVSNLGMFGVRQFQAIINPPHATILAVGAAERRPVEAVDGSIRFERQMSVTLSADHRVVDGALGGQLLSAFKSLIEDPLKVLI
jgi:pyruvate dehydrogenase E2 component (dihydrolipoamide acetyltransferase)